MKVRDFFFLGGLLAAVMQTAGQTNKHNLLLSTDRDLYFVGENLFFSIISPFTKSGIMNENLAIFRKFFAEPLCSQQPVI